MMKRIFKNEILNWLHCNVEKQFWCSRFEIYPISIIVIFLFYHPKDRKSSGSAAWFTQCERKWPLIAPSSLGTPTGILSFCFLITPAKVQHLCGPFEVQSPSEPLNWGQGGRQQIWLPQQLETGSVWEVSSDQFPSREMMLKRQRRLRIVKLPLQNPSLSISVEQDSPVFCPGV